MANGATNMTSSTLEDEQNISAGAIGESIENGQDSEVVEVISDIYSTSEHVMGSKWINSAEPALDDPIPDTRPEHIGEGDVPIKETPQEPKQLKDELEKSRENESQASKVSGYLAKKGKMRMVSSWKKYWFVLDSRLLLYYRSKAEYDALGPCKGSITLGSPCTIKPGSASNCVFQIETRNHTVTLRAENRAEQDKWFHAILGALKQTSLTARMSHFRYSADDLAVRATADKLPIPPLIRQNTMPDRVCNNSATPASKENSSKTMVERIEAIGGQSYTPGQNPIVTDHLKASKASPKLPKNTNLKKLLDKQISITNGKTETEAWVKEEDSTEAGAQTVENDLYDTCESGEVKDPHIYQEIPDIVVNRPLAAETIVENTNYIDIDQNKNNVEYWEPIYATAKSVDERGKEPTASSIASSEEPANATDEKDNPDKKSWQKLAKMVKEERKTGSKRQSFVIRMFKKIKRQDSSTGKSDIKVSQRDEEPVEIPDKHFEKTPPVEEPALVIKDLNPEVLVELTEAIQGNEIKNDETADEVVVPEERSNSVEAAADSEPAPNQLEQLSQLQQLQLPLKQTQNEHLQLDSTSQKPENKPEPIEEQTECSDKKGPEEDKIEETSHTDFDYDIYDTTQRLNIPRPKLISRPKRQKRFKNVLELPITKTKMKAFTEDDTDQVVPHSKVDKLMTIDEILDDLENHHYEPFSRQKVKDLIEKFNETEYDSDEETKIEKVRHAEPVEELNSLLDELSKVANVPEALPNSISSDNGPYSVEEWKNIIPIRKRRHSDPDYDIPRPHSALQIIPNNDDENKMQPTRFFGPVIIEHIHGETNSCGTSITPDSLEVDALVCKNYAPSIEEDRSMRSYTSHVYTSNESHLNHNRVNSKVEDDYGVLVRDGIAPKSKPLSPLVPPKIEPEQAFYLNAENDNNNNDNKLETLMKYDGRTPMLDSTMQAISNPVCFDSLEPFTDISK